MTNSKMFCFQCEQTAGCTGCTGAAGVCGKPFDTAQLQDKLTAVLIDIACLAEQFGATPDTYDKLIAGLFTTVTNVNFDSAVVESLVANAEQEKQRLMAKGDVLSVAYDMQQVWTAQEDIRSLKSLILFGLRGMAAYAYHAAVLDYKSDEVNKFFCEGLAAIGTKNTMDELLPVVLQTGKVNLTCMALLDQANTETYGDPVPVTVPLTVEKGPFIVVTGHDLKDLYALLEQTAGKGVNIYTHGEMLPSHGYPKLKAFPQLKGNFGTAWQNQQKDFDHIPAPILFTTNCLMPPRPSYKDRVFTTELVAFPDIVHIGNNKDFTPVIKKALALGGYKEDTQFTGINGGTQVITGFGRNTVLSAAGTIVDAVKSGAIKNFFLVGGCDGAKVGRNYYTDFVKQTPTDSVILTLACGKFRFNDLDLGTIGGLPRILDMGQCNDAYGAIRTALALADAFKCSVNELPLHLVLSWYEQKAVCILLTLLHLGIQNIYLGPTPPAFISPNVFKFLQENFKLHLTTTPEADLTAILG